MTPLILLLVIVQAGLLLWAAVQLSNTVMQPKGAPGSTPSLRRLTLSLVRGGAPSPRPPASARK